MSGKAKKPRGRPSTFTEAAAAEVCDRLAKGETLASICRDEHMPAVQTVHDWRAAHEEFSVGFARARDLGFDAIAEQCLEIADATEHDTKFVGESGAERGVADAEWISRSKLRVETRLKLLAKWDPKRYGDKLDIEHKGGITIVAQDLDEQL